MRIKKTTYANGIPTTTWYLYNDKCLAAGYDNHGNLIKEYLFHPQKTWMTDPLFQRTADNQVYNYQNDHLGTPQQLIKSNGAVVWRATYTAFGKASIDAGSIVENNLRFPGQYYDQETRLHHNFMRDYDPSLGRYIQADPIGLTGGINIYIYALSNPIRYWDPTGEVVPFIAFWAIGTLIGGVNGALGAVAQCQTGANFAISVFTGAAVGGLLGVFTPLLPATAGASALAGGTIGLAGNIAGQTIGIHMSGGSSSGFNPGSAILSMIGGGLASGIATHAFASTSLSASQAALAGMASSNAAVGVAEPVRAGAAQALLGMGGNCTCN